MVPCPNGKVPYSLQKCFEDGKKYPGIRWVEEQIKLGKIDFLGEVLSQYYGISSFDSACFHTTNWQLNTNFRWEYIRVLPGLTMDVRIFRKHWEIRRCLRTC